jgi:hypothetical protein
MMVNYNIICPHATWFILYKSGLNFPKIYSKNLIYHYFSVFLEHNRLTIDNSGYNRSVGNSCFPVTIFILYIDCKRSFFGVLFGCWQKVPACSLEVYHGVVKGAIMWVTRGRADQVACVNYSINLYRLLI